MFGAITEGKNGDFRQETEEFERALAEVSRNEKLSAGETAYISETDEGDELTKQIAGKSIVQNGRSNCPIKLNRFSIASVLYIVIYACIEDSFLINTTQITEL